ncbi:hypothetical protein BDB00DRAFT_824681 [Zychaea mexicana]|uniref:uncharacterized protein n=1 Tax=Zychaea mexicana TaxID=64656 RepID=UPI0022FF2F67|nr:uncharacterized protein BDB00DRAFT_824681 [Zychaea mexicana]KAI9493174.1 hypothetical protein BDB00DRAFT_824681 [Zychaea mexicana]
MTSQNSIFRQQQQLYKSSHYFGKPKTPAFYSAPISPLHQEDLQTKGRKRRASEDDLMEDTWVNSFEQLDVATSPRSKHDKMLHTIKRNRTGIEKQQQQFPLDKLLAPLDKGKLIELISELVEANPRLQPEIHGMIQPQQQEQQQQLQQLQPDLQHQHHPHNAPQQNKQQ